MLYLSTPHTLLQVAGRDQRGRFIPDVRQAICGFNPSRPGLPTQKPVRQVVTLTVLSADFSKGRAWVVAGSTTLVSGVDFKATGGIPQVAAAIAAALKAAGITAASSGASVSITAPSNDQPFPVSAASAGSIQNFGVSPEGGYPFSGPYDPPERVVI